MPWVFNGYYKENDIKKLEIKNFNRLSGYINWQMGQIMRSFNKFKCIKCFYDKYDK